MFSWDKVRRPILALAPMSGYTDSSFRRIVKEICPSVICFTEFTNVDGILHGNETSLRQLSFDAKKERPAIAQLFGKKPENFKMASKIITELGVDGIDINMGCPARKVVTSDNGSALLKNPALAEEIVRATAESTHLNVSVKMRIGISRYDCDKFFKFATAMQNSGAKLITVHGRTAKQMYGGASDWNPIYELKKILKIPVIGNGDIKSGFDAVQKLGNLDGIMVGRASFGNPWIFKEIEKAFAQKKQTSLSKEEKLNFIKKHLDFSCDFKGEKFGIIEMRKHLACYVRGIPNASKFRQKLVLVNTKKDAVFLLEEIFCGKN